MRDGTASPLAVTRLALAADPTAPAPASAAGAAPTQFTVDTMPDVGDADPADGVCRTAAPVLDLVDSTVSGNTAGEAGGSRSTRSWPQKPATQVR
ncbi:hypothetical protein [Streptomyces sp. NPDC051636]|uniref:hypothetical protein n=1 Tax=Streptomyces sp. NPDC051636 TaxID=3365663 RepID=UPI003790B900